MEKFGLLKSMIHSPIIWFSVFIEKAKKKKQRWAPEPEPEQLEFHLLTLHSEQL